MKMNQIFIILMDTEGRAYLCGPMKETSTLLLDDIYLLFIE